MLFPGEYLKVNKVLCNKNNNNNKPIKQKFDIDEFNHTTNVYEHDKKVNGKYCNESKCKFLLAYFPPNMDTSISDIEFLTYVKLAESLGRIMVLTNVRSKKISTCQPFPFSLYYDINKLQQNFPNVKFITQDEFQKWSYQRYDKPSTSHYYITDGGEENSIVNTSPYSNSLKKVWCLDKFKLKLNDTTPFKLLRLSWNNWIVNDDGFDGRNDLKNFLLNNLQDNSDVLLVRHDIRESIFLNELPPHLPYSSIIEDASTKIINSLRPYIAILWDFENTKDPALPICSSRLLSRVQKTIDVSDIENIYFVSDYPLYRLNDIISLNSTHPVIRSTHRFSHIHTETIKLITSTIPYYTADSLGAMKSFEDTLKDELEESSIRDIIDKLVSIKADKFIGLPRWPCNDPTDSKRAKIFAELRGYDKSDNNTFANIARF
ncbi:hypothetical protein RhiirA4_454243 [Rhizophagus irregularis]|uniref:Uncharacterized protein n=1 Tax=Rhizophagus irregularis TaxID=588596 RepID=A0A2I1G2D7_9GLOM|nr:hypothetical protein RhiirA4_454243 [Rhizophagus irregularis]